MAQLMLDSTILNSLMEETPASAFNGWIEGINLPDIVQLMCLSGGEFELQVKSGGQEGAIYFSGGEVRHATAGIQKGVDAFYDIMCWPRGAFCIRPGKASEITVEVPWNFLLIEALRLADERAERPEETVSQEERPVGVFVVDDSTLVKKALKQIIAEVLGGEIAGEATNGKEALKFLENNSPDLITLDINMPVMGGDLALKHIMVRSPCPVALFSGINRESFPRVMDYFRLGAVDFIVKPGVNQSWDTVACRIGSLMSVVRKLRLSNVRRARTPRKVEASMSPGLPATRLVLILGGMGGLLEIQKVLPALECRDDTAVLLCQEMGPELLDFFADYMNDFTRITVLPLSHGAPLLSRQCWVTGWDAPISIISDNDGAAVSAADQANINFDTSELLRSAARAFGSGLQVMVLSGAGAGSEHALAEAHEKGAAVIVQEPASSLLPHELEVIKERYPDYIYTEPEKMAETAAASAGGGGTPA